MKHLSLCAYFMNNRILVKDARTAGLRPKAGDECEVGLLVLGKETIMRELTAIDLDVESYEQVFDTMGARFRKLGYVNDTYLPSIKKREAQYPTALPVEPYPIAIPHTEATAIIHPFIAPVRLRESVKWGDMSNPDNMFDVRLVFMLGFKRSWRAYRVASDSHVQLPEARVGRRAVRRYGPRTSFMTPSSPWSGGRNTSVCTSVSSGFE